ncbi:MAG: translation initiation factor IF-2 [Endozoicomonadaceae bacterium]|nr:translation initiation factor IF-2 [Endozoicomonadaceae bacterium]
MADVTVEQLANVVGTPVEQLLTQMHDAGLKHCDPNEVVSNVDKNALLDYLKKTHGHLSSNKQDVVEETQRIIFTKKMQQTIKVSDSAGNRKIVNVEVRKKRTLIKNEDKKPETSLSQQSKYKTNTPRSLVASKKPEGSTQKNFTQPAIDSKPMNSAPSNDAKNDKSHRSSGKRRKDARYNDRDSSAKRGRKEWQQEEVRSRKTFRSKALEQRFNKPTIPIIRDVAVPETIAVGELAQRMAVKASDVVKFMFKLGTMVTINQVIDQETALVVVEEMGHNPKVVNANAIEEILNDSSEDISNDKSVSRAPVITVMGHVDHGKTSLLDYIRSSRIQIGEAGGITQHIGAYQLKTDNGVFCFLDTPGHAAFTAMRARGAQATDIVILVVAADDGVMPQTEEAIQHAIAADVPLIVAVNKIDKPDADIERIKNELSRRNVLAEDWGGDVQFIGVSALTGEGIPDLLDAILLQAEVLELKAVNTGPAKGIVLESRLDKGRGPVASILVKSGLLCKGDCILVGHQYGRVRAMMNEDKAFRDQAGPSTPVEILGLDGVPNSGDPVLVVQDERKAREIALFRQGKYREVKLATKQAAKLENMFKDMTEVSVLILKVVLKTDVKGSLEAITHALRELGNKEVIVQVISGGVGGITETDAHLALASSAIVIGFNVRADSIARRIIENEGLDLRYYSVIYDIISDMKAALSGLLKSELRENIIGVAEVRDVFNAPKIGAIAGCMVIEGIIYRNERIRVLREDIVIYSGELESLRRYKDDVNEVKHGIECGIGVKGYNDVKVGDKIEVYKMIEIERSLE